MRARDYIQAIRELLREGNDPDTLFCELKVVLKRKGHEKLHAQILRGVSSQIEKDMLTDTVVVTLARPHDLDKQKQTIDAALVSLKAQGTVETKIDPNIVGGFTATQNGKIIDRSYKKQLLTLYWSLIE